MTDRILSDAQNLKKLVREAEALADDSMIAFARLKQAMLTARQNPSVEAHIGRRALMWLNQAEGQVMAMSTCPLRVQDKLSNIAREKMGEGDFPAELPTEALAAEPSIVSVDPAEA